MSQQDPVEFSLTQAQRSLKSGKLSSRAYVDALIERCEWMADLNALVSTDWAALRASADEVDRAGKAGDLLGGIPLCLKDNINTALLPTTAGTGALQQHMAQSAAPVAQRLFDAGALLGGTGNMHELAFGITSNNAVTGCVRNPWNRHRIAGGSSGGVAAAVAAGMMPAGIGTDTGASVRLPAALCGLVGFRPTVGRYPGAGIVPISHTRDTPGPITRTVEDAVVLDAVMSASGLTDSSVTLSSLRLGVPVGYFYDDLDAEVAANAEHVLTELRAAGVSLVEADIPAIGELDNAVSFPLALYEFMTDLPQYLEQNNTGLTPQDICKSIGSADVRAIFESQLGADAMPEAAYLQALNVDRPRLQSAYAQYFSQHKVDAVIFPTAPLPARNIGEDETVELNGVQVPTFTTYIRNTDPGSNAGIPGITLPSGLSSDGLPLGMELDGPTGSDRRLLGVAAALESVFAFSAKPKLG